MSNPATVDQKGRLKIPATLLPSRAQGVRHRILITSELQILLGCRPTIAKPRDCLLVRLHDLRWGTRNSTAKPGPPESLARKVRTDQAHSRGLGSKKSSGRCSCVFS